MKKIISVILLFTFLLINVPLVYAVTPEISVDTVTANPGATVDVPIRLKNNPGITSMKLSVSYDNCLTLTQVTYGPEISAKGFSLQPVNFEAPVLNWVYGTDNIYGDVLFATLTFNVSNNIAVGTTANITVSYDQADVFSVSTTTQTESDVYFNINNGYVQVSYPESKIIGASVALAEDITVYYHVNLKSGEEGAIMHFTMNGKTTVVNHEQIPGSDGLYIYKFTGVAPQNMDDIISAELILNGIVLDSKDEYSVSTYGNNQKNKTAAELGISYEKKSALDNVIDALDYYNKRAKVYSGYNAQGVGEPKGISLNQDEVNELSMNEVSLENSSVSDVGFYSAGLYLVDTVKLYYKFDTSGKDISKFSITINNGSQNYTLTSSDFSAASGVNNRYIAMSKSININNIYDPVRVELKINGSTVQTLNYNVASYFYETLVNDTTRNVTPLCYSLYLYSKAVATYNSAV